MRRRLVSEESPLQDLHVRPREITENEERVKVSPQRLDWFADGPFGTETSRKRCQRKVDARRLRRRQRTAAWGGRRAGREGPHVFATIVLISIAAAKASPCTDSAASSAAFGTSWAHIPSRRGDVSSVDLVAGGIVLFLHVKLA